MTPQNEVAELQVRTLVESWSAAARAHDIPAILAHHEQDIVMFDLPPPLQLKGIEEYKKTWTYSSNTTSRHKRSTSKSSPS